MVSIDQFGNIYVQHLARPTFCKTYTINSIRSAGLKPNQFKSTTNNSINQITPKMTSIATPTATTALPIILGCMTLGTPNDPQTRIKTLAAETAFLTTFASHGHTLLDTSPMYTSTTSESHLGAQRPLLTHHNLVIGTKIYPTASHAALAKQYNPDIDLFSLSPTDIARSLDASLKRLGGLDSVDTFYFHAPDRSEGSDLLASLRGIAALYKQGKFRRWGISNYKAEEVREILRLCEEHKEEGLVKPAVYQGLYNGLHRAVEAELLGVLREGGVGFAAYNPLAGGLLTGRYRMGGEREVGGRFDEGTFQGKGYVKRYWNEEMFEAVEGVRMAAERCGLTVAECALRWMMHHSELKRELGDAVLIGASSVEQLEGNLRDLEKGPLPKEVCDAMDRGWAIVEEKNQTYWH
jgi:aflatoxin B1 aldehyde reductase